MKTTTKQQIARMILSFALGFLTAAIIAYRIVLSWKV